MSVKPQVIFNWLDVPVSLAFGLVVLLWIFGGHLGSKDLWYDETGQILMSHGIGHMLPFGAEEGGIPEIWQANQEFNLDPGGFTLLLRGWCEIAGTTPLSVRSLPLVFTFFALVFCGLLTREMIQKFSVGVLVFLIVFPTSVVLEQSLEVRAYSMEYCGVFLCCYLVSALWNQPRGWRWWVPATLLVCFFMGSRFSFWPIVLGTVVLLFTVSILRRRSLLPLSLFAGLIFLLGGLIYFAIVHGAKGTPNYMTVWIIGHPASDKKEMIMETFLNGNAIFVHVIGLIGLLGYLFRKTRHRFDPACLPLLFSSTMLLGFQILSVAGIHPAVFALRWNISLHALDVLSCIGVAALAYQIIPLAWNGIADTMRRYGGRVLSRSYAVPIYLLALTFAAFESVRSASYSFMPAVHEGTVDLLKEVPTKGELWINGQALPSVHYFLRYSGLFEAEEVDVDMTRVVPEADLGSFLLEPEGVESGDLLLVHNKVFLPEDYGDWVVKCEAEPSILLQRR